MAKLCGGINPKRALEQGSSIRDFVVSYLGDFGERLAYGGTRTGKLLAEMSKLSVDGAKRFSGGAISETLNRELISNRVAPWSVRGRAITAVGRHYFKGEQKFAVSPLHHIGEGGGHHLGPEAEKVVEGVRSMIDVLGEKTQAAGILVRNTNGQMVPFESFRRADGSIVIPNVMEDNFFYALEHGANGRIWGPLVDGLSELNGMSRADVEKRLMRIRDEFANTGSGGPGVMYTQAEFHREFSRMPSAVKVDGEIIPLMHINPTSYMKRIANTRSNRIGFVEQFGQGLEESDGVHVLLKSFIKEGGNPEDIRKLYRTLHGVPHQNQGGLDPGNPLVRVYRRTDEAMGFMRALSLSGAFVTNIAEVLGNVRLLAGNRQSFTSLMSLVKDRIAADTTLEYLGATNREVMDLTWDANRKLHSSSKIFGEVTSRLFGHKYINQFQESFAAKIASDKSALWIEGGLSDHAKARDIWNLKTMGFSTDDARLMVNGGGTANMYNRFIRNAASKATAGNIRTAEKSLIETSRISRFIQPFQTYAQMKVRSFARQLKATSDIWSETGKAFRESKLSRSERDSLRLGATRQMVESVLGTAAAGMGTYYITSFFFGGPEGAKVAWNESTNSKQDFAKFAISSWAFASFAGPFGAMIRVASQKDSLWRAFYPWMIATEFADAAQKKGKYRALTPMEAGVEFLSTMTPASRIARDGVIREGAELILPVSMMANVFGTDQTNAQNTSIRAYWRWKFNNDPETFSGRNPTEEAKEFHDAMRRSYRAIRKGKGPNEVNELFYQAMNVVGRNRGDVSRSIRARKLLKDYDYNARDLTYDQIERRIKMSDDLKRTIGESAYRELVLHDRFLDLAADTINPDYGF